MSLGVNFCYAIGNIPGHVKRRDPVKIEFRQSVQPASLSDENSCIANAHPTTSKNGRGRRFRVIYWEKPDALTDADLMQRKYNQALKSYEPLRSREYVVGFIEETWAHESHVGLMQPAQVRLWSHSTHANRSAAINTRNMLAESTNEKVLRNLYCQPKNIVCRTIRKLPFKSLWKRPSAVTA